MATIVRLPPLETVTVCEAQTHYVTRQIDGDVGGQDAALLAKVHAKTYDTVRGFPLDAVPLSDARLTTSAFAVTGTGPSALVATVTDKVAEQLGNAVDVGASLLATVPRPWSRTEALAQTTGPVRAVAFHSSRPLLAVASRNEVFFYNLDAQEWAVFSLVSSLQEDITAIAWRPLAKDGQLVVGSKTGVVLWTVDLTAADRVPSVNPTCRQIDLLVSQRRAPHVTSIAWDPRGRQLAVASKLGHSLVVADIPSNTSFSIPSYGGYFTSLSWNGSDGAFLIAGTIDGHVRAWSTANWGCLKWRVSSHPVSKVVSDLNGTKVLAAVQGEPALALIDLASTGSASTTVVKLADVVGPGASDLGSIQSISWLSDYDRIAISFDQSALVLVCAVAIVPLFRLLPLGFVRGEGQAVAVHDLAPLPSGQGQEGALLCAAYESGSFNIVPLYFMSMRRLKRDLGSLHDWN